MSLTNSLGPPFEQIGILFAQKCFVSSLVINGLVVLKSKLKMGDTLDNQTNRQQKNFGLKSSLKL